MHVQCILSGMVRRKSRFQNRKGIPNKPKPEPLTLRDSIPIICTAADLLRILRISERKLRLMEAQGTFPIPRIDPPIDNIKRYRGVDVQRYLDGQDQHRVA